MVPDDRSGAAAAAASEWLGNGTADRRFAAVDPDPAEVEVRLACIDAVNEMRNRRDSEWPAPSTTYAADLDRVRAEYYGGDPQPVRPWMTWHGTPPTLRVTTC